jgi:hypothetical protein
MSTLVQLRDRTEQVLADTGNSIWSTTWIDEGLRQALAEYNLVLPYRAIDTLDLTGILNDSGYEIDLSGWSEVGGCYDIERVWLPYEEDDEIPTVRSFEFWREMQTLYIKGGASPDETDTARLFYTAAHTISGLDSATSTTVRVEHETLLVNGAAGHVAASRALDLTEQATISQISGQQVRAWGLSKLQEFRAGLRSVGRSSSARGAAWVGLPPLDRWDKR